MGWHNFIDVLSKTLLLLWHLSLIDQNNKDFSLDRRMLEGLGIDQTKVD
jgi:hypothetical protein